MDYGNPRKSISRGQYAASVADRILQACKTIEHRSNLPLAMAEKRLTIGRRLPSKERLEWAHKINVSRGERLPGNRTEVYALHAEWIHENPKEEVVLQAVRIGELGITAIPCEVYGITGLKLKRQSPLSATFNLELANGGAGYIPPPEQHRLGGYTTWPARSAGLEEQAEPLIVETVLGLLESVSGKKRRALVDPMSTYAQAITDKKPVAYWRLADMNATQVTDAVGKNHASYKGGVALFLPGPSGSGFEAKGYGSRSVYLAGGYIEGQVREIEDEYSVSMWFFNGLPTDARDVTGTLLSTDTETLLIAGKAAGEQLGMLVLRSGKQALTGKTRVQVKRWHHVTITRTKQTVRVYLDGRSVPEIEAQVDLAKPTKRILIGHDGNDESSATPTFDGKVDEVAVFDRVLASRDIVALYAKSGITAPPTPKPVLVLGPKPSDAASRQKYAEVLKASTPLAYWRLHDESNQSAIDSAGKSPATYEKVLRPFKSERPSQTFPVVALKHTFRNWGTLTAWRCGFEMICQSIRGP